MPLIKREGWAVPKTDHVGFNIQRMEVIDLYEMVAHCKQKRTCIQAGGSIGIWAKRLSNQFQHVYTFEPEIENYSALSLNLWGRPNVTHERVCLGKEEGRAGIRKIDVGNVGSFQTDPDGDGCNVVTIDSLDIQNVDFIQLDLQGYEHFAVEGAMQTINRWSPVIVLEVAGHGEQYGVPKQSTYDLLETLGYTVQAKVRRDVIFTRA